ncbi:adenylate cyclase [Achromatium sp. WMS2]|nr:adenylate cyclase [Achromatium sp. WMS2]
MGIEIERKFLVNDDSWRSGTAGLSYRQGYLCTANGCSVRVRVTGKPGAWITIKSRINATTRAEYEYPIPITDAEMMLQSLCGQHIVEKTRYLRNYADLLWEIDEFTGNNSGLILAEVELTHSEQPITPPPWVGKEVTTDKRYYNSYLATHPYQNWS